MRKISATNVAATSDDATVRRVAQHTTHDAETAKRYYQQMQGRKNSVEAYEALNTIQVRPREDDAVEPNFPKKRKIWSSEEEDVLRVLFELETKETPPSLEECATFLLHYQKKNLFEGRTKKGVQDKCRTIIK